MALGQPGLNQDGLPYEQDLARQQDIFFYRGYLKEKVDLKKVIDHQFVDYALDKLGKYTS